jgi:aminoglycoside phosphotransferase (APT) family kinase protein
MSRSSALGEHRDLVARLFPPLAPLDGFEAVGGGWTCFTYLVNEEWIVQIPRGEHGRRTMTMQLELLPGLAPEVSAPIPQPVHVSREPLAMAYPVIPGRAADQDTSGVWPERLGRLLYDLHLCPPEFVGKRARGPEALRDERRAELAMFRERVFPLLEPGERARFAARFDAFLLDDANWRFATCLTHGDLGPEHVLITPTGDLAGVIDWEEADIGDPVRDLAYFLHAWPAAGERILATYGGPPDARFGDRARFTYLLMPWHEVVYGLDTGRGGFVRSGVEGVRARADV